MYVGKLEELGSLLRKENKRVLAMAKNNNLLDYFTGEVLDPPVDVDKSIIATGKKVLFLCRVKEDNAHGILLYFVNFLKRNPALEPFAFFPYGNELQGEKAKKIVSSLKLGYVKSVFLVNDVFADYSHIYHRFYEMDTFMPTDYCSQNILISLLMQLEKEQKMKSKKDFILLEERLSGEVKNFFDIKKVIPKKSPYFLTRVGILEKIDENTFLVNGICPLTFSVSYKVVLSRSIKKGKEKVSMEVYHRNIKGQFCKKTTPYSFLKMIEKGSRSQENFIYGKKEDVEGSFLEKRISFNYSEEKRGYIIDPLHFFANIQYPFLENLRKSGYPGIYNLFFKQSHGEGLSPSKVLSPKNALIEKALGLNRGQIKILHQAIKLNQMAGQGSGSIEILKNLLFLSKRYSLNRLDKESFRRLMIALMENHSFIIVNALESKSFSENMVQNLVRFGSLSVRKKEEIFAFIKKEDLLKKISLVDIPYIKSITKESFVILLSLINGGEKVFLDGKFDSKKYMEEIEQKGLFPRSFLYNSGKILFLLKEISSLLEEDSSEDLYLKLEDLYFILDGRVSFFNHSLHYRDYISWLDYFSKEELNSIGVELIPRDENELIKWHDLLMDLVIERKNKVASEKIQRIKEKNSRLEMSNDQFMIFLPENTFQFVKEGKQLGHCVANYAEDVANEKTKIFFVREKSHPDTPLCTVELKGKAVKQIQGKFKTYPRSTSSGKDKEIYHFIEEWAKKNNLDIAV